MDIQKEREAFEREFKTKWEIGHFILKMVEFVDESQDYAPVNAVKELSDEYYWVLALNTGWSSWQAAKAQAVPEKDAVIKKLSDQLYAQEMKASAARVLCETACELLDDYAHQDAMVILNDLEQAMKEPAND